MLSHDQRIKDIADRVLWLKDGEHFSFCSRGCRDEFLASRIASSQTQTP